MAMRASDVPEKRFLAPFAGCEGDFRHRLGTRPGVAERFFAPSAGSSSLLAERAHWLRTDPGNHAALLPEGEPLLEEAVALAARWNSLAPERLSVVRAAPQALARCIELGMAWEPDFVLIRRGPSGAMTVAGGCVCFPSSWRLTDKLGRSVAMAHQVVPGLNEQIGEPIDRFLLRLRAGGCWLRTNWGFSRTPERNQHPDRRLPGLDEATQLAHVWLRIEHQAFAALPETGGILFGIRLEHVVLTELVRDAQAAGRLLRQLQTMPEAVRQYKRLGAAADRIIDWIKTGAGSGRSAVPG